MGIGADAGKGEFDHVGLADDHRTGLLQPGNDRRIDGGGRGIGQDQRTGAGRLARDIEQILDADDGAVDRRERRSGAGIGGVRRRPRAVRIEGEVGAPALPRRVGDARERCFQTLARRAGFGNGRRADHAERHGATGAVQDRPSRHATMLHLLPPISPVRYPRSSPPAPPGNPCRAARNGPATSRNRRRADRHYP